MSVASTVASTDQDKLMREERIKRWEAMDLKDHAETCYEKECIKSKHTVWVNWIKDTNKRIQKLGYDGIGHLYGV